MYKYENPDKNNKDTNDEFDELIVKEEPLTKDKLYDTKDGDV